MHPALRAICTGLVITALSGLSALAEGEEHEGEHVFEAGAIRIVHPWARAAAAGSETRAFMEIENAGSPDTLVGAETASADMVHIVGLTLAGDDVSVEEIGEIAVPSGPFVLDPGGLALELHGLTAELAQGGHFDLVLHFAAAGPLEIEVAVEAANARQHSHAGHMH